MSHLVGELARVVPDRDCGSLWDFARIIEALHHHYAGGRSRGVQALYEAFDPDSETVPPAQIVRPDPLERLFERIEGLLETANFTRVPHEVLLTQHDREVLRRLHIDPDHESIEQVAVYHRGLSSKAVNIRPIRKLFRLEERALPTYRRVVVVVRTRHEPFVVLKLFKDVPVKDLELLLPTVRVKMKLLDKLKLSGSGGAAAISAWKLLKMIYTYIPSLAKLIAVPFKILLLPVFLVVGAIYGGKTVLDYSKIRASYVTVLAEHLYAITMASNRAVLTRLADMAGEEDSKEVLIAYALLSQAERPGITPDQLRARAEAFVWDRYRSKVTFDCDDALGKLEDLDLLWRDGERLNVVPLDAALRKTDGAWDDLYSAADRATERLRRQRQTEKA